MGARDLLGGVILLAASSQIIAANATTAFNFGAPADVYLPTVGGGTFVSGCRLLLVLSDVRAAGTTSTLGYLVQDAPDLAGAIDTGNLGTALVDVDARHRGAGFGESQGAQATVAGPRGDVAGP